jgi:cation transport regulator ChaB
MPGKKAELPSTLERSTAKAQRTWRKAHDNAIETYGEEERAHRVAYSALKHSFERVGDHWEPKSSKGPSDPRSRQSGAAARQGQSKTYGGVDFYGNTRDELYQRARKSGVRGASKMRKEELAEALAKRR